MIITNAFKENEKGKILTHDNHSKEGNKCPLREVKVEHRVEPDVPNKDKENDYPITPKPISDQNSLNW